MIAKIEHDHIAAELASVDTILSQLTPSDFVTRYGLESRREELLASLATSETTQHPLASASLYFGGAPVVQNRGIESKFGAKVIETFQNLVSEVSAARGKHLLKKRGSPRGKKKSQLHITQVVHGSFGFQFEELDDPMILIDSGLKELVDEAAKLMASFAEQEDNTFGGALYDIDSRILLTVGEFFDFVQKNDATFRIVTGDTDQQYDSRLVQRAVERIKATSIMEQDIWYTGRLQGMLPEHMNFEYRIDEVEPEGVLFGRVDKSLTHEDVSQMLADWLEKDSKARVRVKRVEQQGKEPSHAYTLLNISSRND